MKKIDSIYKQAMVDDVPIIQEPALAFLIDFMRKNQIYHLLEIGSAIGYSSIHFALNCEALSIDTIERNLTWSRLARRNIDNNELSNRISLHVEDALLLPLEQLRFKPYDAIFVDAAKAQYQRFIERYEELLNEGGYIFIDNLDFHGMVNNVDAIKNRNTKQLVKKIIRFKEWMFNHPNYEVQYYPVGDGLIIARRIK